MRIAVTTPSGHIGSKLEAISKTPPKEDEDTSQVEHAEEVAFLVFPANDETTKIVKPCEQPFYLPAAAVAS